MFAELVRLRYVAMSGFEPHIMPPAGQAGFSRLGRGYSLPWAARPVSLVTLLPLRASPDYW